MFQIQITMDVIFSNSLASFEAYVILLCVVAFFSVYAVDAYAFLKRFFSVVWPMIAVRLGIDPQVQFFKKEKKSEAETPEIPATETPYTEEIQKNEDGIPSIAVEVEETGEVVEVASPFLEEITPEEVEKHEWIREEAQIIEEESTHFEPIEQEEIISYQEEHRDDPAPEELPDTNITGDTESWEQEVQVQEASDSEDSPTETSWDDEALAESPAEEVHQESIEVAEVILDEVPEQSLEEVQEEAHPEVPEDTPDTVIPDTPPSIPYQTPSKNTQNIELLFSLVAQIRTLIARGQLLEARSLIIQWLAIDKNHRELNLILAELYEWDRQFEKAEFIYKDLAAAYPTDGEILEKLANVLIIEKRYDIASEIYKRIVELSWETEGSIYILAHLASELGNTEEKYEYTRKYQKQWPNNPDILTLLAQAEISLEKRTDAIETLKRLKNLTPYNHEIMETIQKLVMEEEMANNFGNTRE